MSDPLQVVRRLRAEAALPPNVPLDMEAVIPRLFPAAYVRLEGMTTSSLVDWLRGRGLPAPQRLSERRSARLHGAALCGLGKALLFIASDDPREEQRFTAAHEAAHFLADHCYPRQELLDRFGDTLRPVLDGTCPATSHERADAILASMPLTAFVGAAMQGRGVKPGRFEEEERRADAAAREMLAPGAALRRRYAVELKGIVALGTSRDELAARIGADYGLPLRQALCLVKALAAATPRTPPSLLQPPTPARPQTALRSE